MSEPEDGVPMPPLGERTARLSCPHPAFEATVMVYRGPDGLEATVAVVCMGCQGEMQFTDFATRVLRVRLDPAQPGLSS